MGKQVDAAFIRRAVEASDLAALRAALFQASGDAELAELGPVASLSPDDRARLDYRPRQQPLFSEPAHLGAAFL